MRILQGWKVKFYAFVTLFLFAVGALAALLWPKSPMIFTDLSTNKKLHTQILKDIPKATKTVPLIDSDSDTSTPRSDEPATASDSVHEPSAPAVKGSNTDEKPAVRDKPPVSQPIHPPEPAPISSKPVDPPISVEPPYISPGQCGGCGQFSGAKGIMCPMTTNGSLGGQACLLNQDN